MSHIFISYAHADSIHFSQLISWLHDHSFTDNDLWYDQHIEGGYTWRDEITTALDETYAVLVVVSATSIKSLYCTYEWAYAMGQGIPVLPLFFEEISIADVPTPLSSKQFINCTDQIPELLKEQLKQLRSTPPQVAAINKIIYETVYDTHRRFFILGWIGDELQYLDDELNETTLVYFIEEARKAHHKLQSLMMDKGFTLSGKQYRHCWKLMDLLQEFSRLHNKVEDYFSERLYPQFESTWLPAFEYFEGNGWWRKWIQRYFLWDLKDKHNRLHVFAEIIRVFPSFDAHDAEILIENHILRSSKKS